ncbi:uncharacterized protein LOC127036242 isoform X1 [Gopherus flavomarginatus]|uniref:uncharacterized protein LOC127036242 isoform X1 n=1 Tax=Gopherus flavomarginatus TaxID=286002 RepID=UPI0021CB9E8D|nr:uncharacterized protein LOC127036242 isoform X1 [Gopherus flavomarginatus]
MLSPGRYQQTMLSGWVQGLSCRGPSLLQSPPHLRPGAVRQCSAGSMVLNGPSARQARPCLTALPGVAIGAGGQRRGWCKSLTSSCPATRGVKRSAAAPLPSMLPSGWSHTCLQAAVSQGQRGRLTWRIWHGSASSMGGTRDARRPAPAQSPRGRECTAVCNRPSSGSRAFTGTGCNEAAARELISPCPGMTYIGLQLRPSLKTVLPTHPITAKSHWQVSSSLPRSPPYEQKHLCTHLQPPPLSPKGKLLSEFPFLLPVTVVLA